MMNFWQTNYVPNNAALVVAGNISRDELKALATQKSAPGAWGSARPQIGARKRRKRIVIVDRRRAANDDGLLQLGVGARRLITAPRSHELRACGLFSSRINLNLREEHGYTYGASSSFVYRRRRDTSAGGGIARIHCAAVTEMFKESAA